MALTFDFVFVAAGREPACAVPNGMKPNDMNQMPLATLKHPLANLNRFAQTKNRSLRKMALVIRQDSISSHPGD